ncbi:hypothetical protein N657DRAFT_307407 [Parathielavia appendiculata]|uniref:Uncharacterized protein n=1 Tax=Parathielavia appendiculata TaxID=2587402 RepID=A0AAN6U5L9_9PEZI|nr:hypothetical protein N657DRAFT_307407 [Parathielavia appendiculata]
MSGDQSAVCSVSRPTTRLTCMSMQEPGTLLLLPCKVRSQNISRSLSSLPERLHGLKYLNAWSLLRDILLRQSPHLQVDIQQASAPSSRRKAIIFLPVALPLPPACVGANFRTFQTIGLQFFHVVRRRTLENRLPAFRSSPYSPLPLGSDRPDRCTPRISAR